MSSLNYQSVVLPPSRECRPLTKTWYRINKRIFDLCVVCLLLPLFVPVMAICMLAIRLESPGPVMFKQWRTGLGGRRFRMYKFRTMVQNAEELKKQLQHLNQVSWPDFKVADDPRITKVGKFLRKTSLDELPQLLNVLKGDMSLVGPRPTSFDVSTYSLIHTERLEVLPGVTGLWQVSGRSDVDFDERVEMDAEYISRQSFKYDLEILFKTVAAVLNRRGAY
jgi:lipopolysaccharide/colanic/teichoic acid biosynthesis glycosyltransferase